MLDQIDKMYEIKKDDVKAAQSPGSFFHLERFTASMNRLYQSLD